MAAGSREKNGRIKPIYVICGKDAFLVSEKCEALLDNLISADQRAMALYRPQANKAEVSDVLDELRTLPFLAERRVVLIKAADKFVSANRQPLERYFDAPCATGVLVLVVETWQKNTKLAKKLGKAGELISVGEVGRWQLPQYAAGYAREKYGMGMDRFTAGLLVELVGDDPGRLCREVDKLAVYVGEKKTISAKDVESLTGHNRMFNAFAVIDAIVVGNASDAIVRLRNMFAMDKSSEFTVVGALAFHFRRMFTAKKLLADGLRRDAIASQLRIFGNKEGFFRQVSNMSLERIGSVLGELARIDYSIKTGQMTAPVAIEQLVLKLAATLPKKAV